ncbi:hypothetical protein QJU96_00150 [Pasteurella skyensis]|uniref:DUF6966 domain-containing protein n=1 Tax=Phocoenobacter skyensis TaxID=97481 RepID=A0AAJ6P2T0_9PAST|nr:hypothetical protein [Pasteurella skyensis]MDP8169705.1 hypothetical protein [Pasteurella skyensis]MDP8175127.1 hypothetical protein [Pasteurella skyensis]
MDRLAYILNNIILVLEKSSENNWSEELRKFSKDYSELKTPNEKNIFQRKLLNIYGGMGSFSDLVLYKDNNLMYEENCELDTLREELFKELKKSL